MKIKHYLSPKIASTTVLFIGAISASSSTSAETTNAVCNTKNYTSQSIPDTPFEYEVRRKGKKIGSHTISFKETKEGLKVTAHTKMKVKLLFVTLYSYEYIGDDIWCDGKIVRVGSRINDNGKKWTVDAVLSNDQYTVTSDTGTSVLPAGSVPTNHWNMDVVRTDKLFNTITGKVDKVAVEPIGLEAVVAGKNTKQVQRYQVRGDLNIDTFYDANGNWSGMQFEHADGSAIEFVCKTCGP